MSEFMFLSRGGERSGSPEEMQKVTQRWISWIQDLGEKGYLKSPGSI